MALVVVPASSNELAVSSTAPQHQQPVPLWLLYCNPQNMTQLSHTTSHHVLPHIETTQAAVVYKVSGLFDQVVGVHATGSGLGLSTPPPTTRDVCRYILLAQHMQRTAMSCMTPEDESSFTLDRVPPAVMALPSASVMHLVVQTLRDHRRIMKCVNHVCSRLHDASRHIAGGGGDGIAQDVFRELLTSILSTVTARAFPLSSSSHNKTSDTSGSSPVRMTFPSSAGVSILDYTVPDVSHVAASVALGEWRRQRITGGQGLKSTEFVTWLLNTSSLWCSTSGGGGEHRITTEVERFLQAVVMPSMRSMTLMPPLPIHDPNLEVTTSGRTQGTSTNALLPVSGRMASSWIADRVPQMVPPPKQANTLDGTAKGLNDTEAIEGVHHVLASAIQRENPLEAKLFHQGAVKLLDAYPLKLKQQTMWPSHSVRTGSRK